MTPPPPLGLEARFEAQFESMSRELRLACDTGGQITWMDARARQWLGDRHGEAVATLAPPGAEARLTELVVRARVQVGQEPVSGWEASLVMRGRPRTVAFSATCAGEAVLLVGSLVPDDYGELLVEMSGVMTELAHLHRETQRQESEIRRSAETLAHTNRQLEESNRGVLALYTELDEKADSLRRTSEVKSRVVSNVSHEFRTPVNSIIGLARLLLARADGPLNPEQDKQIGFILRSATELSEMVNDLLDLSKLEAGKIRLHAARFDLGNLFSALRGMSRPLVQRETVSLVFDELPELPMLETDEGKISQVLRNLISNALKFTATGEVRVSARLASAGIVAFDVRDTGVGIAEEDLERVFEEFTQLENSLQKDSKGTGLGLSLSRKLAELLGGTLTLQSQLGAGSTFTLTVPVVHPEVREMNRMVARSHENDPARAPVLVVEDDRQTLFLYEKFLQGSGFQVVPARSIDDARAVLLRLRPAAIVLDIMLEGETSWRFLSELKTSEVTRDVPVLVVTVTDRENKARALGADEFWMKPMDQEWLLKRLTTLARRGPIQKVLVIDDDEVSRYLVRRLLAGTSYQVIEAAGGADGIRVARIERPGVILLDFVMPGMSAFEVLDELKAHPDTRNIPVIIHTSKDLGEQERQRLAVETSAILNKQSLSREIAIGRIRDALVQAGVGMSPGVERDPTYG